MMTTVKWAGAQLVLDATLQMLHTSPTFSDEELATALEAMLQQAKRRLKRKKLNIAGIHFQ